MPVDPQLLADELRRATIARVTALQLNVRDLRGALGRSNAPLGHALDLMEFACDAAFTVIEAEWNHNPDADSRIQILRPMALHVVQLSAFVEGWLSHGSRHSAPLSLLAGLRRECEALSLPPLEPIIATGEPNNFTTITADLTSTILTPLGPFCPSVPARLSAKNFAILRVPRLEGSDALWRPVTLGHELAHLVVKRNGVAPFDLPSVFDFAGAEDLPSVPGSAAPPGPARAAAMLGLAFNWLTELICDAYAVYRFGPAGAAALAEFLEIVGATDRPSSSHPDARLRLTLMMQWLGTTDADLDVVLDPWRGLLEAPGVGHPPWVDFLHALFANTGPLIWSVVEGWATDRYRHQDRAEMIRAARTCLANGTPPPEVAHVGGQFQTVLDADVINAAWLARAQGEDMPFGRLADKSLDSLEFVRRWTEAGGGSADRVDSGGGQDDGAVLTATELRSRVLRHDQSQLFVAPLLPNFAAGAGLDLRLGNRFIVFLRSRTTSFDPLAKESDPRSMQYAVELAWGEKFVLHPNEVVLAATLEYIVIPSDLTAQVITRSSYGRLGLLSATAVQVHPHFHGCLTLELVNLGVVPLELTPGERIAQLVVTRAGSSTVDDHTKYRCPTGPEFSRVRDDAESAVLRQLSSEA